MCMYLLGSNSNAVEEHVGPFRLELQSGSGAFFAKVTPPRVNPNFDLQRHRSRSTSLAICLRTSPNQRNQKNISKVRTQPDDRIPIGDPSQLIEPSAAAQMLSRAIARAAFQRSAASTTTTGLVARRGFQTTRAQLSSPYHYAEGPYTNVPFNTKTRFFKLRYWSFMAVGFGLPFAISGEPRSFYSPLSISLCLSLAISLSGFVSEGSRILLSFVAWARESARLLSFLYSDDAA